MSKDKKDGKVHYLPKKGRLWHEYVDESELSAKIEEFIKNLVAMDFRLDLMNIEWANGKFSARIKGKYLRRVEDKKEPEKH